MELWLVYVDEPGNRRTPTAVARASVPEAAVALVHERLFERGGTLPPAARLFAVPARSCPADDVSAAIKTDLSRVAIPK